jgi:hypothetical protein
VIEVNFNVSERDLRKIEGRLGSMCQKAPAVLKSAVNQTARMARKDLAEEAQRTYTVKKSGFYKEMKIHYGSNSNPEALITSQGEVIPLRDFKHSASGGRTRAQVKKDGSLKDLEKDGIKAFKNNIAERGQKRKKDTRKGKKGSAVRHIAIAERETRERLHIHELFGPAIPSMLGNEETTYGAVAPKIEQNLSENVEKQIERVLRG